MESRSEIWSEDDSYMLVIYLAGPYSAPDRNGIEENIQVAHHFALELWKLGVAVICPHKNTAYFPNLPSGELTYDTWMRGDREFIRRSDAVYMLPKWRESCGAKMEKKYAIKLGKPVFYALSELKKWLENNEVPRVRGSVC